MHKVSGFDVPCGPMVYGSQVYRQKNQFHPGDLIVLIGTGKAAAEDRGRMLGMMETAAIDVEGNAQWPVGVANRAAWRFPGKPKFPLANDPQRFQSKAGQMAIQLDYNEAIAVLSVVPLEAREAVPLAVGAEHPGPNSQWQRIGAPPPSQSRAAVEEVSIGPASTYLFLLRSMAEKLVGFKIGWAGDHEKRLAEFNLVSLPGFGGLRYSLGRHCAWSTAHQAFEMEQAVLSDLAEYRSQENQEVLRADAGTDLEKAWLSYLARHTAAQY